MTGRARYHVHRCIASAAPRRTPRRVMAAYEVTMETYYYGRQLILRGRRSGQWCSTYTDLDL